MTDPLADYRAPHPARAASKTPDRATRRDCSDCRRSLLLAAFYLKRKGDPYRIGEFAGLRYDRAERKAGRVATPAAIAEAGRFALCLPVPKGRMVHVQPRTFSALIRAGE